jgi:hypothetical protein
MTRDDLLTIARNLHAFHGILPVAVTNKDPMGGIGWPAQTLEQRLQQIGSSYCTGVGMQCGPIYHPVHGWLNHYVLDVDEKDTAKRDAFVEMFEHYLNADAKQRIRWRWGRGPACNLFVRGEKQREKYGSIQLLGNNKYAVGWGQHPQMGEYRWPKGSMLDMMPPVLEMLTLDAMIKSACQYAGIPTEKHAFSVDAPAITETQLSMLSISDIARYHAELSAELRDIENMPPKSGRGTRLYHLGLKFGALARYDANIEQMVADTLARLPGDGSHGDVRDFTRGLDSSKGLAQVRQAEANEQRDALVAKAGIKPDAQDLDELLNKNLPPLEWLVDRFLPRIGTLILVGKPKIGKGFLALELALSLCEGGKFWDEQCHATGILLYMLEDGERRIKERINLLRSERPRPKKTFRIRYAKDGPFRVNPDGSGGLLEDIRKHKYNYPDIGFVVVDMLKAIRGIVTDRSLDAYQSTNQIVAPIAQLAHELDITILIVHHAKKGEIDFDNAEDALTGSNALSGAVDGIWTIWKKGSDVGYLATHMRDGESFDLNLEKKEGALVWNPIESIDSDHGYTGRSTRIFNLLQAAGCELTPRDVALRLDFDDRITNARLHDLRKKGLIQSKHHGLYGVAGAQSRYDAIMSAIAQSGIVTPMYDKLRELHDPEGKYSHLGDVAATGFAFAEDIIGVIERAQFADGKHALTNLDIQRRVVLHKGKVWFFDTVNRTLQPLPWAVRYPWN